MEKLNNATLTDKQEKFVQELIKGKSQREAYKTSYPTSVKWLDKSVDEKASAMMNNVKVLLRYNALHNRLIKEAEDDCIITAKQVLQELANIALANGSDFADVYEEERNVIDSEGNPTGEVVTRKYVGVKTTKDVPNDKLSAIAGIEATNFGIKVKQHDKVKALELIGKHFGMFTDKLEVKAEVTAVTVSLEEKMKLIESIREK